MTISSEVRKAGPYSGNDATTSFPFSFKVFSASDMVVVRTDAIGAETILTAGADYSVALNANQDTAPGGSITLPAPLASSYLLTITSSVPNLQALDLTNQGGFYPRVINAALDRLTILVQQVAEQVSRAVKVNISSGISPDALVASLNANAAAAIASAASAAASEANAAASETAAATSETNAAASEASAAASKTAAAGSASTATIQAGNASASALAAANSEISAASSKTAAANSATAAAQSAQTAATPVASVVAAYLDNFIPTGQLMSFAGMYVPGGWDFGGLAAPAPFANEAVALRRASLSAGSGAFNFGTLA
jgi:hypothetical protein